MRSRKLTFGFVLHAGLLTALLFSISLVAAAQDGSKDIKAAEVVDRAMATSGTPVNAGPQSSSTQTAVYRSKRPISRRPPPPAMEHASVGVTIWRLKKDSSGGTKGLDQKGDESVEQIEAATSLAIHDNVRLGIEPLSRGGFLYVIDREQFDDGTFGKPMLIFPTLRTRQGNNAVKPNVLIPIPAAPSYFEINPSATGKRQVADVLTIILSTEPLTLPSPLGNKAMEISAEQFKRWQSMWGTETDEMELAGGAGRTSIVKSHSNTRSAEGSKSLDQMEQEPLTGADPLPQTVFRATIKKGTPMFFNLPLRFQTTSAFVGSAP